MTPSVTVYGADTCRYTNRARGQLDALRIAYSYIDLEQDRAAESNIRQATGQRQTPIILIDTDGQKKKLVRPNDWELETELIQSGLLAHRAQRPESRAILRGPRGVIGERR